MAQMDKSGMLLMEKTWERIQTKTFTKWVNSHLKKKGLSIEDLCKDLADGTILIQFLEIIGNETITARWDKKPKMRVQYVTNIGIAFKYLAVKNVKLVAIGPEDIADGNLKLVLGMIWTIIQKFAIDDISEDELNAKDALLLWCKKKTRPYNPSVAVENFKSSWVDGTSFIGLIHAHYPNLVPDPRTLDKSKAKENLQLAFDVAETLGIHKLLDPEDLCEVAQPDERSIITYVAQYYHAFAHLNQNEIAGRRVGKLADFAAQIEAMKNDYLSRNSDLSEWIKRKTEEHKDHNFGDSVDAVQGKINEFGDYQTKEKPPKAAEKLNLEALLNAINLKLRNNNRPLFVPPAGQRPEDVDGYWDALLAAERDREDALRRELERQQRLAELQRRFKLESERLEAWIRAKDQYLGVDELVSSLPEATSKLNIINAFFSEYDGSKNRLKYVQQLAAEIVELNASNAAEISAKAEQITSNHGALHPKADAKKADLEKKLAIERRKEELRKEFAEKAQQYVKFQKAAVTDINGTLFGDTLQEVEAYGAKLADSDAAFSGDSDKRKGELDALAAEMEQLGVKENRYTNITAASIASMHGKLGEALTARRAAYDDELERQRAMEIKRKEFAAAAQALVDSAAARRAAIDALQGEPDDLIPQVQESYADGAAEQQQLAALSALASEMSAMGITHNPHTKHTLQSLQAAVADFDRHVKAHINTLETESMLKAEFFTAATALMQWIQATVPTLQDRTFDNTLEGARAKKLEFAAYKTGERAENSDAKGRLDNMFASIQSFLASAHRPPFDETPIQAIRAQWDELVKEEKGRQDAVVAELKKQEKIAALARRFTAEAAELDAVLADAETQVKAERDVSNLRAARLAVQTLAALAADAASSEDLDSLRALQKELSALGYSGQATIDGRVAELEGKASALAAAIQARQDELQQALDAEEQKEKLRVDCASKAGELHRNIHGSKAKVASRAFGSGLEAIREAAAGLDSTDAEYKEHADQRLAAAKAAFEAAAAAGVTENSHTQATVESLTAERESLDAAIADRRAAYAAALAKAEEDDAAAKTWAEQAEQYKAWLGEQTAAVEALQGDEDSRIAGANAIYQGGAPAGEKLAAIKAEDSALRARGVHKNPHTPLTTRALETETTKFNRFVANYIADATEEKELSERAAALRAGQEAAEALEAKKLAYASAAQAFSAWAETAQEKLSEPIRVKTVAAAEKLQADWSALDADVAAHTDAAAAVAAAAAALTADGCSDFSGFDPAALAAEWEGIKADTATRKSQIDEERQRQEANEQLRTAFASQAAAVDAELEAIKKVVVAGDSGDAEAQLASLKSVSFAGVREKLTAVEAAGKALLDAGVTENPHTKLTHGTLKVAADQLDDTRSKKIKVLEQDLFAKKQGSKVTPEQMAEFKEVFEHFDRDRSGKLTPNEFKAAMNSLGEDMSDDEVNRLVNELSGGSGQVSLEPFVEYMAKKMTDQDSKEEVLESFKALAGGADTISETQLRQALPAEKVDFLIKAMPKKGDGYDYATWAATQY